MPELPEAETIARQLHERLVGRQFDRVTHLLPSVVAGSARTLRQRLRNARIDQVTRRGKRIVIHLPDHRGLVFSLGMTGHLSVQPPTSPLAKHTHLRASLRGVRLELRFRDTRRFGRIACVVMPQGEPPEALAQLGLEPLAMTLQQFRERLRRHRQVKALLLDQSVIAGIGNIYADESLYRSKVHPLEIAADIEAERLGRLFRAIRSILRAAIRAQGSSISDYRTPGGELGAYHRHHRVYQRTGRPCPLCRTPIQRITAAGRSTHICPICQPAPPG
jgi:formamidopyrimidine-DNA glycosylase